MPDETQNPDVIRVAHLRGKDEVPFEITPDAATR